MKKVKLTKKCYICDREGASSRDHIPPKGIFPKDIRKINKRSLVTVPAHASCNNSYQKDDELFRNFIISHSYNTEQGKFAWDNTVVPSFIKHPAARIELVSRIEKRFIRDELLGAYIYSDVLKWEEKFIRRQIERIIRGLYYHKKIQTLALDIPISYRLYDDINILSKIISGFYKIGIPQNWTHIIPGFFTYFLEMAEDDSGKGLGVLIFYDSLIFFCLIGFDWTKRR